MAKLGVIGLLTMVLGATSPSLALVALIVGPALGIYVLRKAVRAPIEGDNWRRQFR